MFMTVSLISITLVLKLVFCVFCVFLSFVFIFPFIALSFNFEKEMVTSKRKPLLRGERLQGMTQSGRQGGLTATSRGRISAHYPRSSSVARAPYFH